MTSGLRGCFVVGLRVVGLGVLLFMRRASMMRGCRSESLRGLGLIWKGWIVLSECGISMSNESHIDEKTRIAAFGAIRRAVAVARAYERDDDDGFIEYVTAWRIRIAIRAAIGSENE